MARKINYISRPTSLIKIIIMENQNQQTEQKSEKGYVPMILLCFFLGDSVFIDFMQEK